MLIDADFRIAPRLAERLGVRMCGSVVVVLLTAVFGVAGRSLAWKLEEEREKAFFLRREGPEPLRELLLALLALLVRDLGVPMMVLAVEGRGWFGGGEGG